MRFQRYTRRVCVYRCIILIIHFHGRALHTNYVCLQLCIFPLANQATRGINSNLFGCFKWMEHYLWAVNNYSRDEALWNEMCWWSCKINTSISFSNRSIRIEIHLKFSLLYERNLSSSHYHLSVSSDWSLPNLPIRSTSLRMFSVKARPVYQLQIVSTKNSKIFVSVGTYPYPRRTVPLR